MTADTRPIEKRAKQKVRRGQIEDGIVAAVALAGILVVAVAAPKATKLLKGVDFPSRNPAQRFRERISRLKKKGLVRWSVKNGIYRLELTEAGKKHAKQIQKGVVEIKRPRRWDHMWRIIIFDIPEKKKGLREKVRRMLRSLGLYRLQDSVWVHPYDFEEITEVLKKDLQVGSEMRYIVAAAIEWDEPIRAHFGLIA